MLIDATVNLNIDLIELWLYAAALSLNQVRCVSTVLLRGDINYNAANTQSSKRKIGILNSHGPLGKAAGC